MPIRKSEIGKYPKNWKAIATRIKALAGWTCQACNRPCRQPEESIDDLKYRLARVSKRLYDECCQKPGRFTLTVSHQDHNPENNSDANLRAYCSACHLKYDSKHHAINAATTRRKKKSNS